MLKFKAINEALFTKIKNLVAIQTSKYQATKKEREKKHLEALHLYLNETNKASKNNWLKVVNWKKVIIILLLFAVETILLYFSAQQIKTNPFIAKILFFFCLETVFFMLLYKEEQKLTWSIAFEYTAYSLMITLILGTFLAK